MPAPAERSVDVAVVGAGPGGYVAAIRCAQLGLRTLVAERQGLGGVCLNVGCIPSKALIHAATLVEEIREAEAMGIHADGVRVDFRKTQAWKKAILDRLGTGVGTLLRENKVEVLRGTARLSSGTTLAVEGPEGRATVRARAILLATGSRPIELPNLKFDGRDVVDSAGALAWEEIPKRLAVIGGGVIGLEMGTLYAKLGSALTVVELTPTLLPGTDPDLVKVVARELKKRKAEVHLEAKAAGVERTPRGLALSVETKNGPTTVECDKVLVSVGVRPNTDDLGLEAAGVALDRRGYVPVNAARQTNVPTVYAIGDITGPPYLAHKASAEGLAAAAAIAGKGGAFEPRAIPGVIFTDPEIATVGLQEPEARAAGRPVRVGTFPFTALGRALTMGRTEGLVKVVADAGDDSLLGVGIAGAGASDLIAEAALAIEMGATAADLALTIHAHPTLPEALMEAAEDVHGRAIHKVGRRDSG